MFRPVTVDDLGTILEFIKMLASNEGRPEAVTLSEADLAELLFGEKPVAYGFLAVKEGVPVASALLLQKFSSYRGKRILYIEDLIVSEAARGDGVGSKMMVFLAGIALEMGCDAMEWYALKSDPKALRFYERLGAQYDTPHAILGFDKMVLEKLQEF
tara:strand:- start:15 stop:485 length:471 start_codon:yes stop_codon:yes gene_type:complete